jgi:Domain of unknown function (DUF4258)
MGAEFPYKLTAHAVSVLIERQIPLEWVERVLGQPMRLEADRHDPTLRHALGAIPENDGRVLRVVYNDTVQPWQIVTAYFDRKERGRHESTL